RADLDLERADGPDGVAVVAARLGKDVGVEQIVEHLERQAGQRCPIASRAALGSLPEARSIHTTDGGLDSVETSASRGSFLRLQSVQLRTVAPGWGSAVSVAASVISS